MELPARAKITEFVQTDSLGTIQLVSGGILRFGASACVGFTPEPGIECWLIATKEDPIQGGLRAKTINLSGEFEKDPQTQAIEAANLSARA